MVLPEISPEGMPRVEMLFGQVVGYDVTNIHPSMAHDSLNPGGRLIVELIDLTPQSDDDSPLPAGSALELWAQKLYNDDGQQEGYEQVQAIQ
ncbi:methyltransferase domain-containing protein [Colletotrichum sp. SAR 10_99]|nr:methyltransferase domain-containing protein [Colletotrichum sp. SAR 10_99]